MGSAEPLASHLWLRTPPTPSPILPVLASLSVSSYNWSSTALASLLRWTRPSAPDSPSTLCCPLEFSKYCTRKSLSTSRGRRRAQAASAPTKKSSGAPIQPWDVVLFFVFSSCSKFVEILGRDFLFQSAIIAGWIPLSFYFKF